MQPKPMAETSRLLFPSLRVFIFLMFDIVDGRLNDSGVKRGVSRIARDWALAIVRSLARSCGKKLAAFYSALRNSVGVTPTTRRKTLAKWLGLV